jgi:hypothetical protein
MIPYLLWLYFFTATECLTLIILSFSLQLLNGWRENQWMKFWQSRTLTYPSSSNIFSLLNIIHFINHLNMLILYFVKMNCCLCYIFNKLTHLLLLGSFTMSLYNVNTIVRMLGVCIWEDFTTSCYMRISLWAWPFDTLIIFFIII